MSSVMNDIFPTIKTYSSKWQRSHKIYHEKNKLADKLPAPLEPSKRSDSPFLKYAVAKPRNEKRPKTTSKVYHKSELQPIAGSSQPRTLGLTVVPLRKESTRKYKLSPKLLKRPQTAPLPREDDSRPVERSQSRRCKVSAPKSKPKEPTSLTSSAERPARLQRSLRTETLSKHRQEHNEKSRVINNAYILEWLRGVEEATAREQRRQENSDNSIELFREAQIEHPAIGRKKSTSELLNDLMKAFKSSSIEKTSELSNLKDLPTLPEKPNESEELLREVCKLKPNENGPRNNVLKKSRIPTLCKPSTPRSRPKASLTSSQSEGSVFQFSSPMITQTNDCENNTVDDSNTYTYTFGSTRTLDATDLTLTNKQNKDKPVGNHQSKKIKVLNSTTNKNALSFGKFEFSQALSSIQKDLTLTNKQNKDKPAGNHQSKKIKVLNSTTNKNALSFGKFEFSQALSSIQKDGKKRILDMSKGKPSSPNSVLKLSKRLNSTTKCDATSNGRPNFSEAISPIPKDVRQLAESTPEKQRKRSSPDKNACVVPQKQRCTGRNKQGQLAPLASTALFVTQMSSAVTSPEVSSIKKSRDISRPASSAKDKAKKELPGTKIAFDFEAVETESDGEKSSKKQDEDKENLPQRRPIITSTPDSKNKFIGPELLILADLSSVTAASLGEDELVPLRNSGYEVNSEEILCASDLSFEVDIPVIKAVDSPKLTVSDGINRDHPNIDQKSCQKPSHSQMNGSDFKVTPSHVSQGQSDKISPASTGHRFHTHAGPRTGATFTFHSEYEKKPTQSMTTSPQSESPPEDKNIVKVSKGEFKKPSKPESVPSASRLPKKIKENTDIASSLKESAKRNHFSESKFLSNQKIKTKYTEVHNTKRRSISCPIMVLDTIPCSKNSTSLTHASSCEKMFSKICSNSSEKKRSAGNMVNDNSKRTTNISPHPSKIPRASNSVNSNKDSPDFDGASRISCSPKKSHKRWSFRLSGERRRDHSLSTSFQLFDAYKTDIGPCSLVEVKPRCQPSRKFHCQIIDNTIAFQKALRRAPKGDIMLTAVKMRCQRMK